MDPIHPIRDFRGISIEQLVEGSHSLPRARRTPGVLLRIGIVAFQAAIDAAQQQFQILHRLRRIELISA